MPAERIFLISVVPGGDRDWFCVNVYFKSVYAVAFGAVAMGRSGKGSEIGAAALSRSVGKSSQLWIYVGPHWSDAGRFWQQGGAHREPEELVHVGNEPSVVVDSEFFQTPVEGSAADSQKGGCSCPISFCPFQRCGDAVHVIAAGFLAQRFGARLAQFGRQVVGPNHRTSASDDGEFECVAEFSDIAGPSVVEEQGHGLVADGVNLFAGRGTVVCQEGSDKQGKIVSTLAECGQLDASDADSVQEILAESLLERFLSQVPVGGREESNINPPELRLSDWHDGVLLEHAEERRLNSNGQFADFVEEEGSSASCFEQSLLILNGSGERPASMSEQLAGGQFVAESAAIECEEGAVSASAEFVNRTGHEFLTRAGLPFDQDGGLDAGQLLDELEDLTHGLGFSEHVLEYGSFVELSSELDEGGDIVEEKNLALLVARIVDDFDLHVPAFIILGFQNYG